MIVMKASVVADGNKPPVNSNSTHLLCYSLMSFFDYKTKNTANCVWKSQSHIELFCVEAT